MYIRLEDKAEILTPDGTFNFENSKRKGNVVRKFNFKEEGFEFFNEELKTKMIPKRDLERTNDQPIHVIITELGKVFSYQSFGKTVKLLTLDEEGKIIAQDADYFGEDDDIIIYDDEDWALDTISDVFCTDYEQMRLYQLNKLMNGIVEKDSPNVYDLSNYIIASDSGIIINDIMVM